MQRSGIDTIKYHTWPRIPMGKWQTHSRHHKREPRGQPFPNRWPQSTYKQTHTKTYQTQDRTKKYKIHKRSTTLERQDITRRTLKSLYWNVHIRIVICTVYYAYVIHEHVLLNVNKVFLSHIKMCSHFNNNTFSVGGVYEALPEKICNNFCFWHTPNIDFYMDILMHGTNGFVSNRWIFKKMQSSWPALRLYSGYKHISCAFQDIAFLMTIKVSKGAKIRNRYNQVPQSTIKKARTKT